MNIHRKLLVQSINELLERKLISIDYSNNEDGEYDGTERGHAFISSLFGYPSVVLWKNVGFQELRISVWWKYDYEIHKSYLRDNQKETFESTLPINKKDFRKFLGVAATGYLERKDGKFLQGKGSLGITKIYTRKEENKELESLNAPQAISFNAEGVTIF